MSANRYEIHIHHDEAGYHVGLFQGRHMIGNTYNLPTLKAAQGVVRAYLDYPAFQRAAVIDHTPAQRLARDIGCDQQTASDVLDACREGGAA